MCCSQMSGCGSAGSADWSEEATVPGVRHATRRLLSRQVSVADAIEVALWLAIPYVAVGLVWAYFQTDELRHVEGMLQAWLPSGAGMAAYLLVAGLWPIYLVLPAVCVA